MYKILSVFVIVMLLFGIVVLSVVAEEPTAEPVATPIIDPDNPPVMPEIPAEIPATAIESAGIVIAMLAALGAAFAGLVGNGLVDFLKENVKWLDDEHRKNIGSGATRLIIVLLNVLLGVGAEFLFKAAVQLDLTGLWGAIVTVITVIGVPVFAQAWYSWGKKPPVIINAMKAQAQ